MKDTLQWRIQVFSNGKITRLYIGPNFLKPCMKMKNRLSLICLLQTVCTYPSEDLLAHEAQRPVGVGTPLCVPDALDRRHDVLRRARTHVIVQSENLQSESKHFDIFW